MNEEQMKEYFDYLGALRNSGVTNMFSAAPYLQNYFGLSRTESRCILLEWIESFSRSEKND